MMTKFHTSSFSRIYRDHYYKVVLWLSKRDRQRHLPFPQSCHAPQAFR